MLIYPLGDLGMVVKFDNCISESNLALINQLKVFVEGEELAGVKEFVPSYDCLTIYYDPLVLTYKTLSSIVTNFQPGGTEVLQTRSSIRIPVYYDGPDLDIVASHNNISIEEVIKRHTSGEYLVYMIGFSPGFPYLGGMDKSIATPRKKEPRLSIKAGAVGIANEQTGIYTVDGPGGWQIIGKTPLKIYDINKDKPNLIKANMTLEFYSISEETYLNWEAEYD